jgi:hypothetical protein
MFEKIREVKVFKWGLNIFIALILIVIGAAAVYYGIKVRPQWFGIENSAQNSAELEAQKVIDEVSKIVQLPENEKPTIATVTDIDKLKDQVFFKNAKIGDKILVYSQTKKAYLYRPVENKLIEVGVVNLSQPTATVTPGKGTTVPTNTPTKAPTSTLTPTYAPILTPTPTKTP